ncbi:NADH:ubiquinone reductase (Na(+)-transporting) subunit F [Pontiella agarivorans]|uniref:Na(+)-translocating NADH-quinone reductase subunit F n=1 Tax=Pontiella agarivorans TaxID=3038953 RepID=A0ABU5N218_9BACT|nr:NADH:ubiquinone reductase (Na(+)-transporting) subunit F [Pontiella agarivorans]MDZ8120482.1 NADH:ubiquinone reductase (Na(+)-transporting) subunit F [Pontiella agarivorans]
MENVTYIISSVVVFTLVIMTLVALLMIAAKKLVPQGLVKLNINEGNREVEVKPGSSLLSALATDKIFLPSACGGGGTCAMCKCKVLEGGGDLLPTEAGQVTKAEAKEGVRLACQLKVKEDMKLDIEPSILDIKKYECTVRSNDNVATFIKELVVELPKGEKLDFRAGGYIQIDVPAYKDLSYKNFDIADEYRSDWDKFNVWDNVASNDEPCFRAYSMANFPLEDDIIMLNIRIASPPPGSSYPPGICSSYVFDLKPGDKITISGPYGEFFAQETDREMCFIGGGAGMAPMRSHIYDQLKRIGTDRKLTFWYGGRSLTELFYVEEFRELEKQFPNFEFHIALSDPLPEDNWDGPTGFIHQVVLDNYLDQHEDPTEIEYYLCGPPIMLKCVKDMCHDLGVEPEMILADDFGI